MTDLTKTLPDFLGIGAAKSGTSAIFQYLRQHPQIFMPDRKEIRFFAYDGGEEAEARMVQSGRDHFPAKTLEEYAALFAQGDPHKQWGEISPIYLESRTAPSKIKAMAPHVKLIASLRNPVYRAFSGYIMQVRAGREHRKAEDAFGSDAHHVQAGFYYEQVKRYLEIFPREQMMIFTYEAFSQNNQAVLSEMFRFLGVDPEFEPALNERHNVSSFPRFRRFNAVLENRFTRDVLRPAMPKWTRRLARNIKAINLEAAPKITPEIHNHLLQIYRADIAKLEDLTQIDLSGWMAEIH